MCQFSSIVKKIAANVICSKDKFAIVSLKNEFITNAMFGYHSTEKIDEDDHICS